MLDKEVELFTVAPSVGHWPISYEMNITKPLKCSGIRQDFTRINWDYLFSVFEVDVKENFDALFN